MNLLKRLKRLSAATKVGEITPGTDGGSKTDSTVITELSASPADHKEVYKKIAEDKLLVDSTEQKSATDKMVHDENVATDGADEQMLGGERREEVKFIKGDQQNGDAKIDIGLVNGKQTFTGMTKEELMKYANDPFWVRLRWIFFVCFWGVWIGMLVGSILIIINAPKCAAPQPLPWYKRGLHAKFGNIDAVEVDDVAKAEKLHASGVIYELPAALTYSVKKPPVEIQIKELVAKYKNTKMRVILDLTPNYIGKDSQLVQDALLNEEKRGAFVWVGGAPANVPNNWLKVFGNRTAWEKVGDSYVLSQFEDGFYDLRMNHTLVRQEFEGVLRHLVDLGVQGFRLKNTKFFMLSHNLANEEPSRDPKAFNLDVSNYGFYSHSQTTFQSGLGNVLYDYLAIVKNASADAFLSVAEDIVRPDAYLLTNNDDFLGVDLPMYGDFVRELSASKHEKSLLDNLKETLKQAGSNSWLQWNFADVYVDTPVDPSAFALFMSMLPGVPVVPVDSIEYNKVAEKTYSQIQHLRESPSYMHGELNLYEIDSLIAYSRIKSNNPGYFVIFNPTAAHLQVSNFTNEHRMPEKMTVEHVSEKYLTSNSTSIKAKAKVGIHDLYLEPFSTVVLTYVPVKSD